MRIAIAGGTGVVGRHTTEAAGMAGHEVMVLSRATGVDTYTGEGLEAALEGVDVIIDTTNPSSNDGEAATDFFVTSTANLASLGKAAGVGHLVVLSIVGIDRAPTDYYAAKMAQEAAARAAALPVTIMRATQFHEFPAQMLTWTRQDGKAYIPDHRVQTVAARTVGEVLVEIAEGPPQGQAPDLGGPQQAHLADLAQRFVGFNDLGIEVVAVPSDIPEGALVPLDGARLDGPTFEAWLASLDAIRMLP